LSLELDAKIGKIKFHLMVEAGVATLMNRGSSRLICKDSCAMTNTTRMMTTIAERRPQGWQ